MSFVAQMVLNFFACFYLYGNTEDVDMTGFTYWLLALMHTTFSLHEESHFREFFYQQRIIHTLKESFEGTLEALPEPLLV